jgi:hypothetical protein
MQINRLPRRGVREFTPISVSTDHADKGLNDCEDVAGWNK